MVKRFSTIFWVAGLGVACNVYNSDLLEDDGLTGGAANGGSGNTGGSLTGSGGTNSVGGTGPTGGTGGTTGTGGSTSTGGTTGTGGSTSTGGTTGTGGSTSTGGTGGGTMTLETLENFENAPPNRITVSAGRGGYWFVSNDGSVDGAMTPAMPEDTTDFTVMLDPARGTSTMGGHIFGGGFEVWGANAGFNFMDGDNIPYNASAYAGISLWAKAGDTAASTSVRVEIADMSTFPAGGVCDPDMSTVATNDDCNAHFGKQFNLTTTWTQYQLLFEGDPGFTQPAFGYQAESFTASEVYQLTFKFDQGADFDVWIDDIALIAQ